MAKNEIGDIVNDLLDGVHGLSKSETIVGAPQKAGDATIIPVHRLKVAFGAASAKGGAHGSKLGGDTGGEGAGGAVELDPVAAIAVDKHGHAHLLTVEQDASSTWSALLQEVPDMLAKVAKTLGRRVNHELAHRGLDPSEALDESGEKRQLPEKSKAEKK